MEQKPEICPLCRRVVLVAGSKCRDHQDAPRQKRAFVKLGADSDAE